VVHGDFKCANVLVTADDRIKVVDFGLARRTGSSAAGTSGAWTTSMSVMAGTPACMCPEMLRGDRPDPRSDIWALGVSLYHLACGRVPFQGATEFEVAAAVLNGPPPAIGTHVPVALAAIVERCLAREPGERYQHATEVLAALRALPVHGEPSRSGDARGRRARLPVHGRAVAVWVASCVVLAAFGGWQLLPPASPDGAQPLHVRLAVLPLHVDGEPEDPLLGLAVAEGLVARLARVQSLRVRPTTAVRQYAAVSTDHVTLVRALEVDYLLTGILTAGGDTYAFNFELVRGKDLSVVWSHRFLFPKARLQRVEETMGERIAAALSLPLTQAEREDLGHADTTNPEAHRRYLRGRALMLQLQHPDQALPEFEAAVGLDPGFAAAHAGLAHALARKSWHAASDAERDAYRARAEQEAERARVLAPSRSESYEALAAIYRYSEAEWEKCIEASRAALALNPSLALPYHHLAAAFYHLGLFDLAEGASLEGLRADPASRSQSVINRARAALYAGRFVAADKLLAALEPNDDVGGIWLRAEIRFYLDDSAGAVRALEHVIAREADGTMGQRARASLASVLAARGDRAAAERLLAPLVSGGVLDHHVTYRISTAYAQLGHPAAALEWLRRTSETGFPAYPWFVKDRLLEPVRHDPQFQTLLTHLEAEWRERRTRYTPVGSAFTRTSVP
jgi:eukaryotic-like serine/threonine-protein kinase